MNEPWIYIAICPLKKAVAREVYGIIMFLVLMRVPKGEQAGAAAPSPWTWVANSETFQFPIHLAS